MRRARSPRSRDVVFFPYARHATVRASAATTGAAGSIPCTSRSGAGHKSAIELIRFGAFSASTPSQSRRDAVLHATCLRRQYTGYIAAGRGWVMDRYRAWSWLRREQLTAGWLAWTRTVPRTIDRARQVHHLAVHMRDRHAALRYQIDQRRLPAPGMSPSNRDRAWMTGRCYRGIVQTNDRSQARWARWTP